MRFSSTIVLSVVYLVFACIGLAGQEYLTKDGKLTHQLKVVQLQGGFAGFTGVQYTVAPDGAWTSESLFNQKATPKSKGKLTENDLMKLAATLAKYEIEKLPATSGKRPGANPRTITFEFAGKKMSLVGQTQPKLDASNPTGSVESRFAGIWDGVVGLLADKQLPK